MLYSVLAVGDVVGEAGLAHLERHLRPLQKLKNISFTVVNGENISGTGLTRAQAEDLLATGERGLSEKHILAAVVEETRENEELATISNPDEWARVNGRSRGERVTMVRPLGRGDIAVTAPEPRARGVQEWNDVVPEGIL